MDHLWAPWRREFIDAPEEEGCIFCRFPAETGPRGGPEEPHPRPGPRGASPSSTGIPYNNGHLMVVPRRHTGDYAALDAEELDDLQRLLQIALQVVSEAYRPAGANLGMNVGRDAGAGIDGHLHWHLVPRWRGDTNFMPVVGSTKVMIETARPDLGRAPARASRPRSPGAEGLPRGSRRPARPRARRHRGGGGAGAARRALPEAQHRGREPGLPGRGAVRALGRAGRGHRRAVARRAAQHRHHRDVLRARRADAAQGRAGLGHPPRSEHAAQAAAPSRRSAAGPGSSWRSTTAGRGCRTGPGRPSRRWSPMRRSRPEALVAFRRLLEETRDWARAVEIQELLLEHSGSGDDVLAHLLAEQSLSIAGDGSGAGPRRWPSARPRWCPTGPTGCSPWPVPRLAAGDPAGARRRRRRRWPASPRPRPRAFALALEAGASPEECARWLGELEEPLGERALPVSLVRAEALIRAGRQADAVAVLQAAVARTPRSVEARRALGELLLVHRPARLGARPVPRGAAPAGRPARWPSAAGAAAHAFAPSTSVVRAAARGTRSPVSAARPPGNLTPSGAGRNALMS